MNTVFVTGTDTDVGKTIASAILTVGLNAKYWKPIQTGTSEGCDSKFIQEILASDRVLPESYCFTDPLSPNHAAENEKREINFIEIEVPPNSAPLVIEGAGGLLVPLNDDYMMVDLIEKLGSPCILVARSGLGTLNHTLLSLDYLYKRKIPVIGVILNGPKNLQNKKSIEEFGKTQVLLELENLETLNEEVFASIFNQSKLKEIFYGSNS